MRAQRMHPRWSKGCLSIRMTNELGDNAMYVERSLPAAREKVVTITDNAPLMEAANFLHKGTDLVIVCGSAGLVVVRRVETRLDRIVREWCEVRIRHTALFFGSVNRQRPNPENRELA